MPYGRVWTVPLVVAVGVIVPGIAVRHADHPRSAGTIDGVVFDSLVTNGPLARAEVTIEGSDRSVLSGRDGRFRLSEVPPGRVVLRFYHPRLDSLGFGTAPVAVDVADGRVAEVRLTTPSPRTLHASLCPGAAPKSTGVLLGVVRNVDARSPIQKATVEVRWAEWTAGTDGLIRSEGGGTTVTNGNGTYAACGVPTDVPVAVRASADGHMTGLVEVDLAQRLFAVRDFGVSLADSGTSLDALARLNRTALRGDSVVAEGTATVRGIVRGRDGKAVDGAQVAMFGFPPTVRTASDGSFALRLPSGTQAVDVRAIGYAPSHLTLELGTGERRDVAVTLERATGQALAPVNIVGRGTSFDRTGFDVRMRARVGEFITREQIARRRVFDTDQLLWFVRGAHVSPDGLQFPAPVGGAITGRGAVLGSGGAPIYCSPAYVVDGFFVGVTKEELNAVVRPRDIRGIEVYVEPATAPAIYRRPEIPCGIVLIWTEPRTPPPAR